MKTTVALVNFWTNWATFWNNLATGHTGWYYHRKESPFYSIDPWSSSWVCDDPSLFNNFDVVDNVDVDDVDVADMLTIRFCKLKLFTEVVVVWKCPKLLLADCIMPQNNQLRGWLDVVDLLRNDIIRLLTAWLDSEALTQEERERERTDVLIVRREREREREKMCVYFEREREREVSRLDNVNLTYTTKCVCVKEE